MKEILKIDANELVSSVKYGSGGLALVSLRDRKAKKTLLTSSRPLFYLTARKVSDGSFITVKSNEGWGVCTVQKALNDYIFVVSGNKELPGVTVVLCAHAIKEISRIEWSVNLINENDEYSLYECDYPMVTFDSNRNIDFMSPYGPGEIWHSTEECRSFQSYPSYGASMQYMAFWNKLNNRAFYYGLHDPAPAYKRICFEKKKSEPTFALKAVMPLTDIDKGRNSQPLYGVCVWQLTDGDWYEASQIYREFVLDRAVWKPEADENGRADEPDWFKTTDHWWRVRIGTDEKYVDDILKANADLGYDSPVHLYDWHQIPYDNDYPHYFPARDNFLQGIKKLQAHGVKVMPYINARLWDTRDKGMEDFAWSEKAKPNCTKTFGGEPFIESYSSKEADGTPVRLSIMCPSTACWQEKATELVNKLLNEVGVNAVYMDQIAAAQPYACEDRSHSHRPGGGSWWMESYNNLLDHVNRVRPEGTALSTECTADPFMKHMQSYLTWLWVHNRQVPAFVAVYSGYVSMFGRNYCYMPFDDDEGQRIAIAESLTFGEQLGWNDPLLYLQMKHKDFYRNCVQKRREIGSFFYNGTLLKPPAFKDDQPIIRTTRNKGAYYGITEHTAVFCQHWQRNTDKKKLLILVNASDNEAATEITANLPDGEYKFSGDCDKTLVIKDGKDSIKLPPLSVNIAVYD